MSDTKVKTRSQYINNKYEEFYEKNGYIPKMFCPYHCREIIDIAPTLTAQCGNGTSSSDVLIVVEDDRVL